MVPLETIEIFTDGGCSGNPGPGAWAYILRRGESRLEGSGAEPLTTNNRMELTAVIQALQELRAHPEWPDLKLDIHTDSRYVEQGITDWVLKWERKGWLNSAKKAVKNQDLWKRLRRLTRPLSIRWHWLQSHAGHPLNEACDRMVQQAIRQNRP